MRTSPTDYRGLEVQLQPKLEIARVQSAASLAEVANRKLVVSNLQTSLARLRQEEVGVVEHVEALNAELEADSLGDLKVLDQREVPVLLKWTVIEVAAEIAKVGGAEIGIRLTLCWIEQRRPSKCHGIQIAVDALMDIAAVGTIEFVVAACVHASTAIDVSRGARERVSCNGVKINSRLQTFPAPVVRRPVRSGLEGPNAVILPPAEQGIQESRVLSEWQIPHIVEHQPVTDVEDGIATVKAWPGPVGGEPVARRVTIGGGGAAVPG